MKSKNDVNKLRRALYDLCVQFMIDIETLRVMSLSKHTHSTFVCDGVRECHMLLAYMFRPIFGSNTRCWQATSDVS